MVVGAGIVGLATARALLRDRPGLDLVVLEREDVAAHQSGHNSGVIHSGIYYKPGSAKARMAVAGAQRMVEFCQRHGVAYERCGKLIVASHPDELPRLETLAERALANGVLVERLGPERLLDYEPAVRGVGGLWVAQTGIIDYRQVAEALADQARERGAELCRSTKVLGLTRTTNSVLLETTRGSFETRFVINCAGLYSDKVAELAGAQPNAKIVPFRGEYYELVPERRGLVRGLIYPVPNPSFPFLGVHFTRMIDGSVHAGPNAVLALAREGYKKSDVQLGELWETLTYPAFWRLAARHGDEGLREIARSLSKALFVRSMQTLIPEIGPDDVVAAGAGVRAQALRDDGQLVDDFLFVRGERQLHVCNAPSPAATASLEIAREIVAQLEN